MIKRYDIFEDGMMRSSSGNWMRKYDVLEFIRQLEDTLPDYTEGTYDNDQICDVAYVKQRLKEALG